MLLVGAIFISSVMVPIQSSESLGVLFIMRIQNAAGVHFDTSDDAVAPHSPKDQEIPPFYGIVSERDTRLKYHIARIHNSLPTDLLLSCVYTSLAPMWRNLISGPSRLTAVPKQSSLCTFLI